MTSRAVKLVVIVSTMAAFACEIRWVGRGDPAVMYVSAGLFFTGVLLQRLYRERAVSAALAAAYLMPMVYLAAAWNPDWTRYLPWLSALLGAVIVPSAQSPWTLPTPFRWPAAAWALVVALTWPVVVFRELNFDTHVFQLNLWTSRAGTPPAVAVTWVVATAGAVMFVLLWLDWLHGTFRDDVARLQRVVVRPLLLSIALSSMIALVQALGAPGFLNRTVFGALGRASGGMLDGNAFGTIAALWLPLTLAWALQPERRRRERAASGGLALVLAVGMWASGSRTALLTGVIGTATVVLTLVRASGLTRRTVMLWGGAAVAVVGIGFASLPAATVGPLRRVMELVPSMSSADLRAAAMELWDRNHYGGSAVQMIQEHPVVGVGVGTFNLVVSDYGYLEGLIWLAPDNAQNWYRHQIAELGWLGSAASLGFAGFVGWMVRPRRRPESASLPTAAVRGAILGFGLASLLGVPGQDSAVAVTFAVLVAWLLLAAPRSELTRTRERIVWAGVVLVAIVTAVSTLGAAVTSLRPPLRAVHARWAYRYGLDPIVGGGSYKLRWNAPRAVWVMPSASRYLRLTLTAQTPDADQHPVRMAVGVAGRRAGRVLVSHSQPVTRYIEGTWVNSQFMVMLELAVDRSTASAATGRGGGLLPDVVLTWELVDDVPLRGVVLSGKSSDRLWRP